MNGWTIAHDLTPPVTTEAAGPDPLDSSRNLAVIVEWEPIGGRAEPVSITVRSVRPDAPGRSSPTRALPTRGHAAGPVSATAIRQLALGEMVDALRRSIGDEYRAWQKKNPGRRPAPRQTARTSTWTLADLVAAETEPFAQPARRGVAADPEVYEETARVYRQAYADGRPPRAAVADHFHISPDAAAKRVARARERGLLPPTSQGKSRVSEPGRSKKGKK